MKAMVYTEYGSPDVLRCQEVAKPMPRAHEALVKVRAAAANPLDCGELHGLPYLARAIFGIHAPTAEQPNRLGVDFSGDVEATGVDVTQCKPGDTVFGLCLRDPRATGVKAWFHDQGAFSEYLCVDESGLALKPDEVTFEQAAAAPVAGLTALQGLRDKGRIQTGQKVLINGAAGGVGTFAVQIAKSFGAKVTGVCGTQAAEMVRGLGADEVIDYTQADFTSQNLARLDQPYDLIFDCIANHPLSACRRVLTRDGTYIAAGDKSGRSGLSMIFRLMTFAALKPISRQKLIPFLAQPRQRDLIELKDLMQSGKVKPVIDRCYALDEASDGIRYLQNGHAHGKVVIRVA